MDGLYHGLSHIGGIRRIERVRWDVAGGEMPWSRASSAHGSDKGPPVPWDTLHFSNELGTSTLQALDSHHDAACSTALLLRAHSVLMSATTKIAVHSLPGMQTRSTPEPCAANSCQTSRIPQTMRCRTISTPSSSSSCTGRPMFD